MENKYNHSSLYNEEQMEQMKKEALKEYVESNREYINGAKRKFGIIVGIIVIILVAIKVFF
ncbi:MAG: hypothetical protein IJO32_05410 [Bacilli bacterium]|nr:hypothetical protein [Bacilli bacterium]